MNFKIVSLLYAFEQFLFSPCHICLLGYDARIELLQDFYA